MLPVVGVAVEVHDGKDEQTVGLHAEQDSVREMVDEAATDLGLDFRPHDRIVHSVLDVA